MDPFWMFETNANSDVKCNKALVTDLDDNLPPDGVDGLGTLGVHLDVHGVGDDDRTQPHHDRLRIIALDLHEQQRIG